MHDTMPRFVMDDYDYSGLTELDDDVLLIEWDIAIDRDGLTEMVRAANKAPERVVVAPYRLFETTVKSRKLPKTVWVHRDIQNRPVETGDPTCAFFGLGLTYLPKFAIHRYVDEVPGQFSDVSFSNWYAREIADETPILWHVPAQHLHFAMSHWEPEDHEPPPQPLQVTGVSMDQLPEDDPDPIRRALLRERNMAARRGRVDIVAAVDEQLAR